MPVGPALWSLLRFGRGRSSTKESFACWCLEEGRLLFLEVAPQVENLLTKGSETFFVLAEAIVVSGGFEGE